MSNLDALRAEALAGLISRELDQSGIEGDVQDYLVALVEADRPTPTPDGIAQGSGKLCARIDDQHDRLNAWINASQKESTDYRSATESRLQQIERAVQSLLVNQQGWAQPFDNRRSVSEALHEILESVAEEKATFDDAIDNATPEPTGSGGGSVPPPTQSEGGEPAPAAAQDLPIDGPAEETPAIAVASAETDASAVTLSRSERMKQMRAADSARVAAENDQYKERILALVARVGSVTARSVSEYVSIAQNRAWSILEDLADAEILTIDDPKGRPKVYRFPRAVTEDVAAMIEADATPAVFAPAEGVKKALPPAIHQMIVGQIDRKVARNHTILDLIAKYDMSQEEADQAYSRVLARLRETR